MGRIIRGGAKQQNEHTTPVQVPNKFGPVHRPGNFVHRPDYDRPSIEKWLAGGHLTCPVTMQTLDDTTLVPNHTLRHLIDQWIRGDPDRSSRPGPTEPAAEPQLSLASLKLNLQSPTAAAADAVKKIRILSVESDIGQACLIQLGFFPLLLHLLFRSASAHDDSELVEAALDCVLSLSPPSQLDSLNMLKEAHNLASLVVLLEQGNIKIKTSLCYLLELVATSPATKELSLLVGRSQRVLRELISLMQCNKRNAAAAEAAVRATAGLCMLDENWGNVIREGGVGGLIAYLSSSPGQKTVSRALATLELLLGQEAGKSAFAENANAVRIVVRHVFVVSADREASEHAVGALLAVCCGSVRLQTQAVEAGVLTQLLLLLQSQCGSKAKSRARALLKLLRSVWAGNPGECNFQNDK
uniref:U-box domain-containing protein n=1 Tax=Ananas comosus var. bracteatus TaxID=296719 RepID=A0A6V7QG75_ANACO|nr:unnamed protein product [Ananas comosus var. bracteatus]